MKNLLIIITFMAGLLMAGKSNAVSIIAGCYQHETPSEALVLNNGAKWKVDNATNNNVKNLKAILRMSNSGNNRSLSTYHKTANSLQTGLDKMIRECRMKGPDHLALHKWLEPLMVQVTKLKQTPTVAIAAHSLQAIKLQLKRYDQYFVL
jgi:hypothetical protein